ncbi:peroxiredoxin-like family protein [uncultured Spongiibacter sp.]|uniref:peroxiredoxin family protein n=1 Tax=uncultured Spongiibacter sp. TaxID=870896 RepID=UPI002584898A|nr:peroxiredoxin-like family protein [uncultured Spongiibacter sp.]
MTVHAGDRALPLRLTAINGEDFDIASLAGRPYLLSFFRFASCPFCNMRVHELVKRFDEFTNDFTVVAVFDSPLDNLQEHAADHHAPFPILADETGQYYERYSVQRSILGVIKGMLTRLPIAIRGMCKGYVPTTIKGSMTTMPAIFLIDRDGIVRVAHYGKDEGDHLPFDDLLAFCATQDKA